MSKEWYRKNTTVWQRIGWAIQYFVNGYSAEARRLERESGVVSTEDNNFWSTCGWVDEDFGVQNYDKA